MKTRIFMLTLLLASAPSALAQPVENPFLKQELAVHSGMHDGGQAMRIAYQDLVDGLPDSRWTRLRIGDYELGTASYIVLRSLHDGGTQRLDAASLPRWSNATAIFNGNAIEIELHVAPKDRGVFVSIDQLIGADPNVGGDVQPAADPRSICGAADNRVASNDNRVGRVNGACTAWYITNGAFLTAGHCADTERDQFGNPAPDGNLDLGGVVEFNIPQSAANGAQVIANPEDQFPVLQNTVVWNYDGVNTIGEEWAVFEVGPNDDGEMPWERYGSIGFRPSRENPAVNDTIRITGCGVDNLAAGTGGLGAPCCTVVANSCTNDCNANSQTLQTHSGPYVQQVTDNANDISLEYRADTMGGNSGSPIIWQTPSPDVAIGIHTNAGCTSAGGANQGTAFEVNALETAMRNVTSVNARFVDVGHPFADTLGDGTILRPFETVTAATVDVPDNGVVSIVAGTYTAAAGNTFIAGADGRAIRLEAPVGSVVIGN